MKNQSELLLRGIDGANPLGFLAALGATITVNHFCPEVKIYWRQESNAWRPVLLGCGSDEGAFIHNLHKALSSTSTAPFDIKKKMPFSADEFSEILKDTQSKVMLGDRRLADFLVAYGSEVLPPRDRDNKEFQNTRFIMVRSGDSAGQGFPFYARKIRDATEIKNLQDALFETWEYRDDKFSLRWDPLEDQRYALGWYDPSTKKDKYALKTMIGANSLALEALVLFPTMPIYGSLATTGFFQDKKRVFFTWPIWNRPVTIEILRSLVSLAELQKDIPPRDILASRGIVEIYRCERIITNKYYHNFTPAVPV